MAATPRLQRNSNAEAAAAKQHLYTVYSWPAPIIYSWQHLPSSDAEPARKASVLTFWFLLFGASWKTFAGSSQTAKSISRDKKRVAAIKTFNAFLRIGSSVYVSWCDFSPSTPITKDIYEQYCTFLVKKCKTLGTAEAYASAIRGIVEMDFGSDHPIVKDSRWYKNVRRELVKTFVHKCQLSNTSLVNGATPADKDLIASLCGLLFQKGERDSFHDRFLLSTQ
jgi:hypothetical protein